MHDVGKILFPFVVYRARKIFAARQRPSDVDRRNVVKLRYGVVPLLLHIIAARRGSSRIGGKDRDDVAEGKRLSHLTHDRFVMQLGALYRFAVVHIVDSKFDEQKIGLLRNDVPLGAERTEVGAGRADRGVYFGDVRVGKGFPQPCRRAGAPRIFFGVACAVADRDRAAEVGDAQFFVLFQPIKRVRKGCAIGNVLFVSRRFFKLSRYVHLFQALLCRIRKQRFAHKIVCRAQSFARGRGKKNAAVFRRYPVFRLRKSRSRAEADICVRGT